MTDRLCLMQGHLFPKGILMVGFSMHIYIVNHPVHTVRFAIRCSDMVSTGPVDGGGLARDVMEVKE